MSAAPQPVGESAADRGSTAANPPPPHVVRIDRKLRCDCPTLPPAAVEHIEGALRKAPWYRDRYAYPVFREAVVDVLRRYAPGGLALIAAPRLCDPPPPPFEHHFEPIPLSVWDPRLRTLSGAAPTRQERRSKYILWIAGTLGAAIMIALILGALTRFGLQGAVSATLFFAVVIGFVVVIARAAATFSSSWFLVPAGVAILKRGGQPLRRPTRYDHVALLRWVRAGQSTFLQIELIAPGERPHSRPVSEREALSFLAAWSSPLPPPDLQRLAELARP